jgi:hypothetical protein
MSLYCKMKLTYSNITWQVIWLQYNCKKYNTRAVQCDYTVTINERISNITCQVLRLKFNGTKYNTTSVQCHYNVQLN